LEEPIEVPSESLLFTIPYDLHLPNHHIVSISAQATMEGTTCIVEEEFPGEFLHFDSSVPAQDTNNKGDNKGKETTETTKEEDIGIGLEDRGIARGGTQS